VSNCTLVWVTRSSCSSVDQLRSNLGRGFRARLVVPLLVALGVVDIFNVWHPASSPVLATSPAVKTARPAAAETGENSAVQPRTAQDVVISTARSSGDCSLQNGAPAGYRDAASHPPRPSHNGSLLAVPHERRTDCRPNSRLPSRRFTSDRFGYPHNSGGVDRRPLANCSRRPGIEWSGQR
jgi:hypothetical protein